MKNIFSLLMLFCGLSVGCTKDMLDDFKDALGSSDKDISYSENIAVPNNQIWYTNGSKTEPIHFWREDFSGANIKNQVYVEEHECWIILFDGVVTSIGDNAFDNCSSLTSVTIPDSVTTIGDNAFDNCSSLTSVTIPDSVTTIGEWAFGYCSSLTSVTIGASVTTIGNGAFQYCCSLTSVTIPDSVTTIGDEAFAYCSSLTSVTIPDSVTTIGEAAFRDCSSLTSVTIPDSVTTIGESAFANCSSLQEFNGKFASEDSRCLIIDGVLNSFAIGCGATEYIITIIYKLHGCGTLHGGIVWRNNK